VVCSRCEMEMDRSTERLHYRGFPLDNVWMERCVVYTCGKCGDRGEVMPDPETVARDIVRVLVTQAKRLDGRSIVFLRKAMKLKAEALADIVGVDRVTMSRWENGQYAIRDGLHDFRLRAAAIDRVFAAPYDAGADDLRKRLFLVMQHTYDPSKDVSGEALTISALSSYHAQSVDCPEPIRAGG
jgi:transcriptional regulator with XRE-family HTH domain